MRLKVPELRRARIEIIPMIDTIFFLLVFFMVTWVTIVKTSGLELARARVAQEDRKAPTTIELSVSPTGNYFVDGVPTTKSLWQPRLQAWLSAQTNDGGGAIVVRVAASQKTRTLLALMDGINQALSATHRRNPVAIAPDGRPEPTPAGQPADHP